MRMTLSVSNTTICPKRQEYFCKLGIKADAEPWEKYSASVGLAFCEKDDMHFTDVLKRADKRMYEAKMKHKEKYGSYR